MLTRNNSRLRTPPETGALPSPYPAPLAVRPALLSYPLPPRSQIVSLFRGEGAFRLFEGITGKGMGCARGNLAAQLPLVAREFPAVKGLFAGTINLNLDQPLCISKPDYMTRPIEWMPGVIEQFSLTHVYIEAAADSIPRPAWIYAPSLSPYRFNDRYVEILAPFIEEAKTNTLFRLHVNESRLDLGKQMAAPVLVFGGAHADPDQ